MVKTIKQKIHRNFISQISIMLITSLLSLHASATSEQQQVEFDHLVDACLRSVKKDQICEFIIEVKEIGVDTVEMIKRFANLTPTQYAILTAANSIANGRIRIRGRNLFNPEIINTLDIQRDKVNVIFETTF